MNNPFIIGYAIALACVIPVLIVQVILSMIEAKKRGPWKLMIIAVLIIARPAVCQDYGNLDAFDAALKSKHTEDSIARATATIVLPESTMVINFGSNRDTSGVVFVPSDNPAMAKIIDCDRKIDSIKTGVGKNKQGKKLLGYDPANQRGFLDHLLHYNIVDTATVTAWAGALLAVAKLEKTRCESIMETQRGDDRAVIFRHIRALDERISGYRSYVVYLQRL